MDNNQTSPEGKSQNILNDLEKVLSEMKEKIDINDTISEKVLNIMLKKMKNKLQLQGKYIITTNFDIVQKYACGDSSDALVGHGENYEDAFKKLEQRENSWGFELDSEEIIDSEKYFTYKPKKEDIIYNQPPLPGAILKNATEIK